MSQMRGGDDPARLPIRAGRMERGETTEAERMYGDAEAEREVGTHPDEG
ncbi:MAG TPA: hypothetical protein VLK66_22470 [Longimicrobium sp.]|nr:hypothetical protein [Longimicrobium sp.]